MGKRNSESFSQQKQGSSSSKKKMGKRSSESRLQQKQGSSSSKKKMGKRSPDSIMQQKKSSKTMKRELKDLGPTLKELEYGREPPHRPCWMDTDDEEDWKQNRQSFSSDDESSLSPEDKADYRRQCGVHSEAGLQYYNKISRTKYEMVEALDQVVFLDDAIWIHCNFTAKPQVKPTGDKDAQAQLFFAEMHVSRDLTKHLIVVKCHLLKDGKTKAGDGCVSCGGPRSFVTHPPNGGFWRGYDEYETRALRRRSIV